MTVIWIFALCALIGIALISVLNALTFPRLRPASPARTPHVSILIPARNEADVIGETVVSHLRQDYPHYEIIVLGDGSADGSTVVGMARSSQSGMMMEAFVWSSQDGMLGLGDFPQNQFHSYATAVSADGSVVVGSGRSVHGVEAFRWTATSGMVGLGDLPGGQFWSGANDVSRDGNLIVGMVSPSTGSQNIADVVSAENSCHSSHGLVLFLHSTLT